MTLKPMIAIVIPTLNEAPTITRVVEGLFAACQAIGQEVRVFVADGGSWDETVEKAQGLARNHPGSLQIIRVGTSRGYGSACVAGLKAAMETDAQYVILMGADGSHDPAEIPRFLEHLAEGFDLVQGSRHVPGATTYWPLGRLCVSRAVNFYARLLLRVPLRDISTGYRAWRREALERTAVTECKCGGFDFLLETLWRARVEGLALGEVPIHYRKRASGRSKLGFFQSVRFLWTVIRLGMKGRRPVAK